MLIGVLVSGLTDGYTYHICRGIEREAEKHGDKCVFIPGKYIGLDFEQDFKNKYGYCFNTLFSYGALSCFDGLIIEMASVTMYAEDFRRDRFAKFYDKVPHVFVSYDKSQFSNVTIDNKAGLREALEYLHEHGATKFAMLGGPENNSDAKERRDCFDTFLKDHKLRANADNYEPASFFLDASKEAEKLFSNNSDAEVFICANDILATYMYGELQKQNLTPGKDVSVVGFDDSDLCVTTYPSISSIRTDVTEVGKESYNLLRDAIEGKPPRKIACKSQFVIRDSVCHRDHKKQKLNYMDGEFYSAVKANVDIDAMSEVLMQGKKYFDVFATIDETPEEKIPETVEAINSIVDEMFFSESMAYLDWEILVDLIERHFKKTFLKHEDGYIKGIVTDCYVGFLKKVMKYSQTANESKKQINMNSIFTMEAFFRDTMQYSRNTETNYSRFLESIDFLGIRNAYLYLYDAPISNMPGELFKIPRLINLKAVLKDGVSYNIPQSNQQICSDDIFTNEYVDLSICEKLIMFPIYSENYLYGIILCDMRRDGYRHSELFTNQISSAIRMLQLRMENKKILDEYEESVRKLKENNITLDNMSKTDPLTGLNNRRGFGVRIENVRTMVPNERVRLLVGFCDMNDLKIVNDRFGHDDGDYALKTIASVLTDFVTTYNGFAARIGGDEFAFAIVVENKSNLEKYRKILYETFDAHNKTSNKPYNVCVSIGYYAIEEGNDISLEDALVFADEMLYTEKLTKKNVIKSVN